ncbi:hypothetical protein CC78DRAFT_539932 [Lojkania enalia]|uniref:Uncharacterized protein n=1 Tax=Lojkania enalia TaxID=147567 RepID=A0A9P4TQ90_9PLEO|nr:hypothetical protein CC78DRAFT_539932 [Didymosphaeria enalia]
MLGSLFFSVLPLINTSNAGSSENPSLGTIPVEVRECSLMKGSKSLFPSFASWLSIQPTTLIPKSMERVQFQHDVNGTCMEVQVYNWSCDYDLNVTGPGLANAVTSIAKQCDGKIYSDGEIAGPFGFGYYTDLETGHDYTKHLNYSIYANKICLIKNILLKATMVVVKVGVTARPDDLGL